MVARRDSNYSHSYRSSVDFFGLVYHYVFACCIAFFRRIISTIQQPFKTHEYRFDVIHASLRHKARKPMIGARKRASALRVALNAEFAFCATTPVG